MSGIHFIADTHLSADTPALNMLLMQNMAEWMGKIDALYILGNFFEVWLGDDIRHHVAEDLVATLQAFATRTPVYLQHGSRDFLLGADFAQRAGVTFLPEVASLQAYGQNIVLLHGDALYPHNQEQADFRTLSRTPAWQERVLCWRGRVFERWPEIAAGPIDPDVHTIRREPPRKIPDSRHTPR